MPTQTQAQPKLSEHQEHVLRHTVSASRTRVRHYGERSVYIVPDFWGDPTLRALQRKGMIGIEPVPGSPFNGYRLTKLGRKIGDALADAEERDGERRRVINALRGYGERDGETFEDLVAEVREAK